MSARRFIPCLVIVAAAHLVLVLGICSFSGCSLFEPEPEVTVPVEFIVEVPAAGQQEEIPSRELPAEPVKPTEHVDPPEPKPKLKRTSEIEVSRERIKRNGDDQKPPTVKLTPEEIRRRLALGAKEGDRTTVIPEEETRCLMVIRETLYAAWRQPSTAEAGSTVVRAEISFNGDGRIVGRRLAGASGNSVMDTSVMQAIRSVQRINGLTARFLERHQFKITVAFKVE